MGASADKLASAAWCRQRQPSAIGLFAVRCVLTLSNALRRGYGETKLPGRMFLDQFGLTDTGELLLDVLMLVDETVSTIGGIVSHEESTGLGLDATMH